MNKLRTEKEPASEKATSPKAVAAKLPSGFASVINGTFLTREKVLGNMPFILFCAGLMLVYIAYGYSSERVVRDLDHTGSELKELRSEYITVRAQLEKQEQQSQVASGIGELGLRESRVPPLKITVDDRQLEKTRKP